MDELDDKGWIDLHIGFFDRQFQAGKQTRTFPSQKFIDLVEHTVGLRRSKKVFFIKEDPKETIELRHKINDRQYRLVPYKDTPKTIVMRERLKIINDFNKGVLTILPLTRKELIEMKPEHRETLDNMMLNGSIALCEPQMIKGSRGEEKQPKMLTDDKTFDYKTLQHPNQNEKKNTEISTNPYRNEEETSTAETNINIKTVQEYQEQNSPVTTTTITTTSTNRITRDDYGRKTEGEEQDKKRESTIPITGALASINTKYQPHIHGDSIQKGHRKKQYYSIKQVLKDYPWISEFCFKADYSKMFRVFSDTNKRFNHHGRFYGDPLQSLPKWMRGKIILGGKEVVECDYSSLHPTMLYTMVGATPPDNIYLIDKGSNPQLRKEYKAVLLVSINHKDPETLWSAVSLHFREELGYQAGDERLTKNYIMGIYERLLEHNKPIANYMNTGVALRLMRKDSEIADKIMYEFVTRGIPIRCIHDSFIVPAEYEHELKVLMVEFFKEVMDTEYEIGIATERVMKNNPKKAIDAPVLNVEIEEGEAVEADDLAYIEAPENNSDNDLLDDNLKYFEGFITDGFDVDVEIPKGKFSKKPERYIESRFEGIRI